MHLLPAVVCAVLGAVAGWFVPRLIGVLPEPEADPSEEPGEFPDKVPYAVIAAAPRLALRSAVACAVAAGLLGLTFGWVWALPWLVFMVPVGCALTICDYTTWYLPSRIVNPSYAVVGLLVLLAAAALGEWSVVAWAAAGFLGLGLYYGLMWLISPRLMAFGDVRLGGLLGLALGPLGIGALIISVFAAGVIGALAWPGLKLLGRTLRRDGSEGLLRERVPFGPFLVVGALVAAVAGQLVTLG